MPLDVHISHPPGESALDHLRALLLPEVCLTLGPGLPEPANYRVLVAGRPSCEQVEASEQLTTLIIPWAGLPAETRELMQGHPQVAIHNLHHNASVTGETAVALMMAAARLIIPCDRALRQHDWRPRYGTMPAIAMGGKRVLILGYGSVGRHVAQVCSALGMEVSAVRRRPDEDRDGLAQVYALEVLPELLPRANVLMVCLPHTPETEDLIGAAELDALPPSAILVNVGRGPIVNQAALYDALRDGTLFAAGLDVWYNYPPTVKARANTPPADHPFHELDNVVMSPHRGGHSDRTQALRMEHLAASLNAAARGEAIPNRVDLEAGY